jgi:hypothetical protein
MIQSSGELRMLVGIELAVRTAGRTGDEPTVWNVSSTAESSKGLSIMPWCGSCRSRAWTRLPFLLIEGDNMLTTNVSFLARVEAAGIVGCPRPDRLDVAP